MKRLLNILVLLTLAWQASYAQNQEQAQDQNLEQPTLVKNVSYTYRNDDHFNAFADSEVDSIKFSRIDADGVEHTDFVTQVVYTPDSIYRIPLAVIDSVVTEQPKIELQDDVVMLSDEQRAFVVRADSTSILFRSDIPRDLLPERGEVILAMPSGTQQSIQFAGRVLRTQHTADGVLVICTPDIQLGDIFRRFTAVMFTSPPLADKNNENWDVPHSGNREKKFDPFSNDFKWEPKTEKYYDEKEKKDIYYTDKYISGTKQTLGPYEKNLLDFVEEKPAWMNHGSYAINAGMTFDIAYRQKFLIDFFKDEDDWIIPSLYLYWRPTLLPSITGTAQLKVNAEWDHEIKKVIPDVPAIGIWIPPTPVSPPIRIGEVNIHVTQFYVKLGGEMDVSYSFTAKKIFDVELELNSSGTHATDMTKKANGGYVDKSGLYSNGFKFGESDLGDDVDHIGKLYFWFAWKPTVGLSLINERVLTAKVELKVGPWVELNFEKAKGEPTNEYARFYQTWAPSHLMTKLHLETDFKVIFAEGTKAEQKFSLRDQLADWNIGDGKGFDFKVNRFGVFPGFGVPKLTSNWEQSFNQRGVLSFTTPYKNPDKGDPKFDKLTNTFLSADLGLGIYRVNFDGTQTEVATSFTPKKEKGWFNSDEGTYTTEFSKIKRGVYKVAPLFDAAFFSPMRATPETEIVIPPSVFTEEATGVAKHHCFMNGYALGLQSYGEATGKDIELGFIIKKAENKDGSSNSSLTLDDSDLVVVDKTDKTNTRNKQNPQLDDKGEEDKLYFKEIRADLLTPATEYIYRAWASYWVGDTKKYIYGDIKKLTTQVDEEAEERCVKDMGLSVDWACYNVGASLEYQFGNYYAWGEKTTKKEYTAANYKLPSKKNIAGDKEYDVAMEWSEGKADKKAGNVWRMPTQAEFQELIDNCDVEWTTIKKVQGMKFTSRITGVSMFLPAAGNKYGKKVYSNGIGGCYWTGDQAPEMEEVESAVSNEIEIGEEEGEEGIGEGDHKELTPEEKTNAWRLHFNNVEDEGKEPHNEAGRCFYGRSIRPVREKKNP
ncbi:MAG: hypothetical protein J6W75_09890 [Bacteroidaceae bacterium]|nr:hypothetical protein [Bacteroidaceae bacterium]